MLTTVNTRSVLGILLALAVMIGAAALYLAFARYGMHPLADSGTHYFG